MDADGGMVDPKLTTIAFGFGLTVALTVVLRIIDSVRKNAEAINKLRHDISEKGYVTEEKLDNRLRLHLEPLRMALAQLVPSHRIPPAPSPPPTYPEER